MKYIFTILLLFTIFGCDNRHWICEGNDLYYIECEDMAPLYKERVWFEDGFACFVGGDGRKECSNKTCYITRLEKQTCEWK